MPIFTWLLTLCAASAAEFKAGSFSFSDELGGFRILSVSGTGSVEDPIILEEELFETAPVILVIRRIGGHPKPMAFVDSLHMTKVVKNSTSRVWNSFELELQETRNKPSVYGDGLSFNQMESKNPAISSDSFAKARAEFEPHDRVRFDTGHVDPDGAVRFSMILTDPTPVREFYLLQDPKLLFAWLKSHSGQGQVRW